MARSRRLVVQIVGDPKSAVAAFNTTGAAAGGFARRFAGAAAGVAGSAALIGGAVAVASVNAFADFDEAMTNSLAIMGDVSEAQEKQMVDAAREMAKQSTFSAKEAAEAYFFLASAGLNAEQSIAAMPQVTAFAQAGNFDLATATDLLTDAQSALGLTVDDTAQNLENMTRASDVLVAANTLANATVQQFSESLTNKAGAALKVVGKDIEEGVAVLAAFADQGVKGAEAGTALNIVMREFQTKGIKFKDEMAAAGISVFDASGEMRNMADIVADLEGALAGMSDEQKKATLLQIGFNDKSIAFIQTLLGTSDKIRQYEADLRDAGGITEEVATKQLDTFNAQMSILGSKLVDVGLTIGNFLMPHVMNLVDGFINFVDNVGPKVQPFLEMAVDFFNWLGDLLRGKVSEGLEQSSGLFAVLRDVLSQIGDVLVNVVWPIVENFGKFLGNTLTGNVGDAGRAFVKLPKALQSVIRGFNKALSALKRWAQLVLDLVKQVFGGWRDEGEKTASWFSRVWSRISTIIKKVFDAITVFLDVFVGFVRDAWIQFGDDIIEFTRDAWDFIKGTVENFLDIIIGVLDLFIATFTGDWKGAWAAIKNILKAVWEQIKLIAKTAIKAVKAAVMVALGLLKAGWDRLWAGIVNIAMSAWNGIRDVVDAAVSGVKDRFNQLKDAASRIWDNIKTAIGNKVDSIKGSILGFIDSIKTKWSNLWGGFKSTAANLWAAVIRWWSGVKGTFKAAWDTFWDGLAGKVSSAWSGVVSTIKGVLNGLIGALETGINYAISGLNALIRAANKVPFVSIPTVGSVSLPRLAAGGTILEPGLAMVGERGPEILSLPRGAQVAPLGSGGMLGREITVIVELDGRVLARAIGQPLVDRIRLRTSSRGA